MIVGARELGRVRGAAPGPTLILVGGLHGNEPAGAVVARHVLARLDGAGAHATGLAGEVVAFEANVAALAAGRRYLQRDLNRQFTDAGVAAARAGVVTGAADDDPEAHAVAQLADLLDAALARARGPVFALDLHTTSAEGVPFAIVGASAAERDFATRLPVPGLVGLHETVEGTLGGWLGARGCVALAVEGGQHQSPAAVANLEAIVLVGLATAGLVPASPALGSPAAHELLVRVRGDLPPLIEVVSRHDVQPDSGFRMEPGFMNIQRTAAGTLLAREHAREIRAPFDGLVLLPLYQPVGSDGFFYGRELDVR